MSFWSVVGPEPKRKHRWVVTFSPPGVSELRYALKTVDKPKAKIVATKHKWLNHAFKYPGRLEWEAISMTFASVSQPDATFLINEITKQAGYGVPSNAGLSPDQMATIGKNKFIGALGIISISQVDADGNGIEQWDLHNGFFTDIQYGDLSYEAEELVEIKCTVEFDWAKLVIPVTKEGTSQDGAPFGNRPPTNGMLP